MRNFYSLGVEELLNYVLLFDDGLHEI